MKLLSESNFEYKITKRRAVKVEQLPEPAQPRQTRYHSIVVNYLNKDKLRNRHCVRCPQVAVYKAYFKVDKSGTLQTERYCSQSWISGYIFQANKQEVVYA